MKRKLLSKLILADYLQIENKRLQKQANEAVAHATQMKILYKLVCKELEDAEIKTIKEFAKKLTEEANKYAETHVTANLSKPNYIPIEHIYNLIKEVEEKFNAKS